MIWTPFGQIIKKMTLLKKKLEMKYDTFFELSSRKSASKPLYQIFYVTGIFNTWQKVKHIAL